MMRLFQKNILLLLLLIFSGTNSMVEAQSTSAATVSLNGKWQMGFGRKYTSTVEVPSIANDPAKMNNEALWYRKEIKLPGGNWTSATLELKGARFQPQVFVNGEQTDKKEGGMAPVFLALHHAAVKPGNTIVLEIALASLKDVPATDASYTPQSDQWRSDISSGLWDDVMLHVHGNISIDRIIPFTDYINQQVNVHINLKGNADFKGNAKVQIIDQHNTILLTQTKSIAGLRDSLALLLNGKLKSWTTDQPNLYHLKLTIADNRGKVSDIRTIAFGVKNFAVKNKQFYLNGQHFVAKGPTVVWHRWVRTQEGRELGYDTAWFSKNIIRRTKDLGGNYLRFHLGLPPEKLLDLCDQYGLIVQYEWNFFHGMPASKESLLEQYKNWLDLAMRHPCVSLIHPYNETGGDQLKTVWMALDELLPSYPPLVLEDRDVLHIHKYWWSLFENLGLYYDSASIFPLAVMADEFGGNYLDGNGDMGAYTTVKETFLRFLGRQHTAVERLAFHAAANARVAEYWRRIGAAGFSPFCALGSNEDGSHWFLGPLKDGNPKPVWNALAAAFSPQSVSIDIWDRDFIPGQQINLPVYLFNDESKAADLSIKITVEDKAGKIFFRKSFTAHVAAFDKKTEPVAVDIPTATGDYFMKAELLNKPVCVKYPVISSWDFRVLHAVVPATVQKIKVAVPEDEPELISFLEKNNISVVATGDQSAGIILTSLNTWNKLAKGDTQLAATLQSAIAAGRSVVMLDVGDRQLGQGYPKKAGDFGPLQSVMRLSNPAKNSYPLFGGIALTFTETADPESHLHPDKNNRELWGMMPDYYTRLWNGLRGGLIVPAADMELNGLSSKALMAQWKARGADEKKLADSAYYAYELQGFYEFSGRPSDKEAEKKLRDKVIFLVQDAPALANSINPNSPVIVSNLNKGYHDAEKGMAENLVPLANCAKNLTQTPVVLVSFGPGKGKLIVSQLLTAGRLAKGFGEKGFYGTRYDEVVVQYVLNMMKMAVGKE